MPDYMLFGEGWKGEIRFRDTTNTDEYISYISKIEFTQNQLEVAAPEPLTFKYPFRVSKFLSTSGRYYFIAVSGDKPPEEVIEQAILVHQPHPLAG